MAFFGRSVSCFVFAKCPFFFAPNGDLNKRWILEIGGGAFGAFNVETIEKWLQIHNPTPASSLCPLFLSTLSLVTLSNSLSFSVYRV